MMSYVDFIYEKDDSANSRTLLNILLAECIDSNFFAVFSSWKLINNTKISSTEKIEGKYKPFIHLSIE